MTSRAFVRRSIGVLLVIAALAGSSSPASSPRS
jgi:hypothetical protein